MKKALRRWITKKLFKKEFFYQDPDMGTEFYFGQTTYYDLTIMMYDTQAGTFREFLVDFHTMKEIFMFQRHGLINPNPLDNKAETMIPIVRQFVERDKMSIIKSNASEVYGFAVLGKVMAYRRDEQDLEVLSLKRIAYLPMAKNSVLGIDTMAIPREAADIFITKIKKLFKNVDIEIDLEGDSDAINQDN